MDRPPLEVAEVFRRYGPAYREQHGASLSTAQRRVMTAIEVCRTAALGGHVEQCDQCGHQRISYNSCGNRHCPKCQSLARAEWLQDRQAELLDCQYFHVVFTLPEQMAAIAYQNKRVVYGILFRAAAETLRTIAADPKHLGALWRLAVPAESPPARLPFVGEDGVMPVVSRPQPGRPQRLVYVRMFADFNIWRIETSAPGAPSSSPAVVAISSTRIDCNAQFSIDGRRVALTSNRSGGVEVWLADLDGANAVQLTSMGAPVTAVPRWSPDAQTIAFHSNLEGQFEIYRIPASGGKPRRLTSHPANDQEPSFSRDGQWIYFGSNRTGEYQIWKIPPSGGEAVQVTHNGGDVAFESPDRAYVYYTQTAPGAHPLWRLPISGGQPVKVLEGVMERAFVVLERGIYYIDRPSGEARLQFFDFATGRSTTVARNLGEISVGLTVSPDGRTILYSRVDASVDDLMLVENFR